MSEGRDSRCSGVVRLQTFSVSALWVDNFWLAFEAPMPMNPEPTTPARW